MKIWIDMSNAPHVNFFYDLIKFWESCGHSVIVTARPHSNTLELLNKRKLKFYCIGRHYGKSRFKKVFGFLIRCFELWFFLRKFEIDRSCSQSSFYSPVVSFLLKIKCLYTNDNEYAFGNIFGFLLANKVLLPKSLYSWSKKRVIFGEVMFYEGVKEGVYLHNTEIRHKASLHPRKSKIYFRTEPWNAQYHSDKPNLFFKFIESLLESHEVHLLPRTIQQKEYFRPLQIKGLKFQDSVSTLEDILYNCDYFIGAGGSMTRELAFLGKPSISVYTGNLLSVDLVLIKAGVLKQANIDKLGDIRLLFKNITSNNRKSLDLLKSNGLDAFKLISKEVISY